MSGRRQPIRRESISPSTAISPAISDFHRRAARRNARASRRRRPVKGSFDNGWPAEIQQRVLSNWHKYGYR
ncbi:hypothetical protein ACIBQ0_20945 [Nocardia nova]|uniref:hypothetical protein n=1 Tax=Nocardia TaxID=1817 RepID=UPI0009DCEB80|nr:hypothetical protein [Nocardia sp. NRRL WC-3656]